MPQRDPRKRSALTINAVVDDESDILTRAIREPDVTLTYRSSYDEPLDVYCPADTGAERGQAAAPLVVLIHGGFWRERYDRTGVRPLAAALAGRGAVVAVPEYRRVGGGGRWPAVGEDIDAALADVAQLVGDAAPGTIDPAASFVLVGHSAGGHLALWGGLRAAAGRIGHIVALAPVSDLRDAARLGLGDGATQALLGGEPDEIPGAYADADPLRHLPSRVSVTLIQGDKDEDVPVELNRRVVEKYSSIDYVECPDAGHMALIDPTASVCRNVVIPTIERPAAPGHTIG